MIRFVVATIMLFAIPSAADAQTGSTATVKLLMADIAPTAEIGSPAERKELLTAIKAYCSELASAYPRNSPSEDQWLVAELAGDSNRITLALSSSAFGRRMAKQFVDGCQTWTTYLDKMDDMKGYVGLAHTFLIFSDGTDSYARKNNVDVDRFALKAIPKETAKALLAVALRRS
jgi:hypothetical protein